MVCSGSHLLRSVLLLKFYDKSNFIIPWDAHRRPMVLFVLQSWQNVSFQQVKLALKKIKLGVYDSYFLIQPCDKVRVGSVLNLSLRLFSIRGTSRAGRPNEE